MTASEFGLGPEPLEGESLLCICYINMLLTQYVQRFGYPIQGNDFDFQKPRNPNNHALRRSSS
jgi:hypothetical protein